MLDKLKYLPLYKSLLKYVSLHVLSLLCISLYFLTDTFFIANGVGNNGLIALNFASPFFSLIGGFGFLVGIGGAIRFSIASGQNDKKNMNRIFMQAIFSGLFLSTILLFAGIFFSKNIVILLGAKGNIIDLANIYLKTVLMFSIFFTINNIFLCFIRNDKNPKLVMIAMVVPSFVNIILDYIFVFPLGMGMFGAAIATGLSPIISLSILSFHFIKKKNHFYFVKSSLIKNELKNIFLAGFPSFITEISNGLVIFIFNLVIFRLIGNVGVGAYAVIANIGWIFGIIFNGIGEGAQPLISYNYGAKRFDNVLRIFYFSSFMAAFLGIIFYFFGRVFSEQLIALFNKDGDITLKNYAMEGIRIYFLAYFVMGINIIMINFFAGIVKLKQAFSLSLLRGCIGILPIVLILSNLYKLKGIWMTVPIVEIITFIIGVIYVYFIKRLRSDTVY
ncbi:MAG: MATE family efflux transporter [Elusimicrobiota bacterium]|jgi:putative MATE family efflux protein|nr:MATE family efflux transporter [Elusimicrobiota bacterium]